MRVIAGSRKSLPLKAPKTLDTRPTTDRIKETLFNMLNPYLSGCRFLDLFSGSGGIGIEALSRGAVKAVFVEKGREACAVIRENLAFTRFTEEGRLIAKDAFAAISELEAAGETFDLIFLDPPYKSGLGLETLKRLSDSPIVSEEALVVLEAGADEDPADFSELGVELIRDKRYKTNRHLFFKKRAQKKERESGQGENDS